MSWIPDLPGAMAVLKRIEEAEDTLLDSTELFWLFCTNSMSPHEYEARMAWWKGYHLQKNPKVFLLPEADALM